MTGEKGPLISVVMPSYNHAAFIGRAAASVLAQTYTNLELIIVDNNSADGTDGVLAAIQDPRLKVVKFSNNGVIAASRNLGIKQAAGAYVAFIDSDDIWLPGKLAAQVEAFGRAPGAVLAYSRFRTITGEEEGAQTLPRLGLCASGDVFRRLYLHPFIACSGVMAARAALEKAGGFSEERELIAIEDMDLWLRLSGAGRVLLSAEEPLFLYRVHPGNLSQAGLKSFRRAMLLARRHAAPAGPWLFVAKLAASAVSITRQRIARWQI